MLRRSTVCKDRRRHSRESFLEIGVRKGEPRGMWKCGAHVEFPHSDRRDLEHHPASIRTRQRSFPVPSAFSNNARTRRAPASKIGWRMLKHTPFAENSQYRQHHNRTACQMSGREANSHHSPSTARRHAVELQVRIPKVEIEENRPRCHVEEPWFQSSANS